MPIKGVHTLFYADDAQRLRVFLRDQLGLPARDVGEGWLINDFTSADMGVHPTDHSGAPPAGTTEVSFYCDDLVATMTELTGRGVVFEGPPQDQGFAMVAYFEMPVVGRTMLYQPRY